MPFDPNLPSDNSLVSSSELRDQFTGLSDNIGSAAADANANLSTAVSTLSDQINDATVNLETEMNNAIQTQTAALPGGVLALNLVVSNPPTQAQVQAIADKLDELLNVLRRA